MSPFEFALYALAIWRVCHLLACEDGPFGIIFTIRIWLMQRGGSLMDCPYCLSVWLALPIAVWYRPRWLYWLALSGASCLLQAFTERKNNG